MEVLSSRVLLRPGSFEVSRRFYEQTLGLHVYREWRGGVVFFLGGGFLEISGNGTGQASESIQLWLQVRDIDTVHEELKEAGVAVGEPPALMPWGLREMQIQDPDGVILILVEVPADHPLRRRTPEQL